MATRLGVFVQSLDKSGKVSGPNATACYEAELKEVLRENLQLKAELRRAQEERGIYSRVLRQKPGVKYPFILQHQDRYAVQPVCRLLGASRISYDAWLERPPLQQSIDDAWILSLFRELHEASGHI